MSVILFTTTGIYFFRPMLKYLSYLSTSCPNLSSKNVSAKLFNESFLISAHSCWNAAPLPHSHSDKQKKSNRCQVWVIKELPPKLQCGGVHYHEKENTLLALYCHPQYFYVFALFRHLQVQTCLKLKH